MIESKEPIRNFQMQRWNVYAISLYSDWWIHIPCIRIGWFKYMNRYLRCCDTLRTLDTSNNGRLNGYRVRADKQSLSVHQKARHSPRRRGYFFRPRIQTHSEPIWGPGKTVEIDESKFGKTKYHRGKLVEGGWVFGGINQGYKDASLNPLEHL